MGFTICNTTDIHNAPKELRSQHQCMARAETCRKTSSTETHLNRTQQARWSGGRADRSGSEPDRDGSEAVHQWQGPTNDHTRIVKHRVHSKVPLFLYLLIHSNAM